MLADLLIGRRKLDGPDGAQAWITRLRDRNLNPGPLKYLEAALLMARGQWAGDAAKRARLISQLESARTLLVSDPTLSGRINLMLTECLGRAGAADDRLAALRRAAESPEEQTATQARMALAAELEAAGQLDDAQTQYLLLALTRPEARLDVARIAIRRTRQMPRARQDWQVAERRLKEAEQAVPAAAADLALLHADLLSARQRPGDARQAIEAAIKATPGDIRLRQRLAGIFLDLGEPVKARETLDRAEKELGPSVGLTLARVETWSRIGGDEAKSALTKIADTVATAPAR